MDEQPDSGFGKTIVDDVVMIVLALVSVFLLVFEILAEHTPQQSRTLAIADISIALVFLVEFCVRLYLAENRLSFFARHWWELLAAIPLTGEFAQSLRAFNLLRLFRLVRLLRLIRFLVRLKIILDASKRFANQSYLIYVFTLAGTIIMSGALGFHYMEAATNPNVDSLWDSFWWAIVTISTVGYGDIYPVTTGGRILAIFMMLGGIAAFSSATAGIAAQMVSRWDKS